MIELRCKLFSKFKIAVSRDVLPKHHSSNKNGGGGNKIHLLYIIQECSITTGRSIIVSNTYFYLLWRDLSISR